MIEENASKTAKAQAARRAMQRTSVAGAPLFSLKKAGAAGRAGLRAEPGAARGHGTLLI